MRRILTSTTCTLAIGSVLLSSGSHSVSATETTSTVTTQTTVVSTSLMVTTTTEQITAPKVQFVSYGGSEYEVGTFKENLTVGEKGQIRRPKNSPLKDSIYSFDIKVADPSILSFDETGNWTAHKAGITEIIFGVPSDGGPREQKLKEELERLGVELVVQDVAVSMTVTVTDSNAKPMYRLYNPNNKEHFYTASLNEKDTLVRIGWGKYEGIAWQAPSSGTPVYRLFNPILRDHHYTMDKNEVKVLTSKYGWKNEGIAWYSAGDKKLHRLFHKGLKSGSHHYTLDENEVKVLQTRGWKYEGVAWYGQ